MRGGCGYRLGIGTTLRNIWVGLIGKNDYTSLDADLGDSAEASMGIETITLTEAEKKLGREAERFLKKIDLKYNS